MKYKKAKALYDAGKEDEATKLMHGDEEAVRNEKRKKKRGLKSLMEQPPEPEWKPQPPQKFQDLYEAPYRKFWPAMEILARREGSGPARVIDGLGAEWRESRVPPKEPVDAVKNIAQSASADIRAAKAALGGPLGAKEESLDAVDLEMPIRQPEIQQARPRDRDGIPTSDVTPESPKAYIARGRPPEIPSAAKQIEELDEQFKEAMKKEVEGKKEVERLRGELDVMEKLPKATNKQIREERKEKTEVLLGDLKQAKQDHKEAVDVSNRLQNKMLAETRNKGQLFVKMYPAGAHGQGVNAKVHIDALRPMFPEFDTRPPVETTYSSMNALGVYTASVLPRSWKTVQDARCWHRTHERRRTCFCQDFL